MTPAGAVDEALALLVEGEVAALELADGAANGLVPALTPDGDGNGDTAAAALGLAGDEETLVSMAGDGETTPGFTVERGEAPGEAVLGGGVKLAGTPPGAKDAPPLFENGDSPVVPAEGDATAALLLAEGGLAPAAEDVPEGLPAPLAFGDDPDPVDGDAEDPVPAALAGDGDAP